MSNNNNGIVNIHGRDYVTVAKRVQLAHDDNKESLSIETEVVRSDNFLVVKAIVKTKKGTFTGTSAVKADTKKEIEKESAYEVCETSAIGRALGFAGYGIVEGIATADEMAKASYVAPAPQQQQQKSKAEHWENDQNGDPITCERCGKSAKETKGTTKGGKPFHGIFCSTGERSHTKWLWN